jgi:hypothetical protein
MRCQFDVAHGPTCYCHRPATKEFRYGGERRVLCANHYAHEDMRLHNRTAFSAYLESPIQNAVEFLEQYESR